ncbi:MAG: pyridoxamine 5'-phosphate oxidase [Bacteroidia bacterium]|jgi:pyridoxamine 5'-phosphate oxidase
MEDHLRQLRKEYQQAALDETHACEKPLDQFYLWFDEALKSELPEPNAMTLSTISPEGRLSSRIVLLRKFSDEGFQFFTNYTSHKGQDAQTGVFVALNFFWPELERQVRIEGKIFKASDADSDAYFASRPRGSQIGAWASPQSREIPSRSFLEQAYREIENRFQNMEVARPPHWGGFNVIPDFFEFWQGRESRLHDRICYRLEESTWRRFRKAP